MLYSIDAVSSYYGSDELSRHHFKCITRSLYPDNCTFVVLIEIIQCFS